MSAATDQSINVGSETKIFGRSLSNTIDGAEAFASVDSARGQRRVQIEVGQSRVGAEGTRVAG
jgi:hypothetical protein